MIIIIPPPILSGCGIFFSLSTNKCAIINDTNVAAITPKQIANHAPLAIIKFE